MAPHLSVRRIAAGLTVAAVLAAGCTGESQPDGGPDEAPSSQPQSAATEPTDATDGSAATSGVTSDQSTGPSTSSAVSSQAPAAGDVVLTLGAGSSGRTIDPRLLGTNLPAWLGPETLADPWFRDLTATSGVTVVRMPGGSWSNAYEWLACEQGQDGCFWTWAARPSDFADFLDDTGLAGMWTVSINATAESAAAAVAFFNGDPGDDRPIGVDRNGVDWETVGTWARLRADNGHSEPVRIELWEIGNEVYGGRPELGGDECASFGWEDVWTCDGTEYVEGDDGHDGFLTIREAMWNVDPSISVGAVGVAEPSAWSDWGNEIIGATGEGLDFYVVHDYGFDASPSGTEAIRRPGEAWPGMFDGLRDVLPAEVPIAITEYNLVSFASGDTERTMTRAANALYIADTIGQMAMTGVTMANQWNLANGTADGGTDYGMIDLRDGSVFPQFHAMRLWSLAGGELLDVEASDTIEHLRVYPTRRSDGTIATVLINLADTDVAIELDVGAETVQALGTLSAVWADDLADDDLVEENDRPVAVVDGRTEPIVLPAWSMNVVELATP